MKLYFRAVISFCFVCGFMAIFMQTLSLGTERWLFTIEPRPINLTDRNGHQREVSFVKFLDIGLMESEKCS